MSVLFIVSMFAAVGGFFLATLFGIDASYGDKTAAIMRNIFICVGVAGVIFYNVACFRISELPYYQYTICAYYIDGGTKTLYIKSRKDPYIYASRGVYCLKYGGNEEIGVVRFDIIQKKEISKDDEINH